jgi:glycosyl transferase family 2/type I phosphodiesterase/nucleotide pyrophosphatase/sulfatase-like protein
MAGGFEIWAARVWNVFNEGRPFSLVYPALVLLVAAPLGLGPDGPLGLAVLGTIALAAVLAYFSFPLRGRALLWLATAAALPALEPWRAPGLLAGALAGYLFFTVFFWGTLYYRLRTGAPWTNFSRFWRLVLTNSDPTSGNALEQVPKLMLSLSAGTLLSEQPGAGAATRIAAVALLTAVLGMLAWRQFARWRLPHYPPPGDRGRGTGEPLARRVYVIVVDGCNRERLRQADTPTLDRLAREGTEYLAVEPAYPARTVVCFSSMLTGATPAEHGMRSNFAPRLRVRRESVFDVLERHGRRGRLVGIAHLLDPFPAVTRPVSSVQPTARIDSSLRGEAERVVDEEDPDLLVLQLLAADQTGHVRGTRNPDYLDALADSDRQVAAFLAFLDRRGKLEGATVVVMADHGQGRGIGGHGHLDWGERPVPFVVWGQGAVPGAISRQPRSVLELSATVSALLGVELPAAARGRPLVPGLDPALEPGALAAGSRCLALVVARDEEALIGDVLRRLPPGACGLPVDRVLIDDGSLDRTAGVALAAGARVVSHPRARGLGAALRTGLELALAEGYAAVVYLDGDGEYEPAELERLLEPIAGRRADYVLGSRFLGQPGDRQGMSWHRALANRAATSLLATLMGTVSSDAQTGYRAFSARAVAHARIAHDYNYAQVLTLSLWGAGIEPVEVPVSYRRRANGRSFVRYPEYFARVTPAVWRQFRSSRKASSSRAAPIAPLSRYGQAESANNGNAPASGPNGASDPFATKAPPPPRTSR